MGSKIQKSKIVFQGRVFDVRQDLVELPNGRSIQMDIVAHHGAVTIIPLDDKGRIWFVRQYRHAAGEAILELPAGVIEEGESPEECARRETREEIGMAASELKPVGEFFLAPGYSTEYMYVYLAKGLTPDPLTQDPDELLSIEQVQVDKAFSLGQDGAIRDAKSLAALFLARSMLTP
jgi:ADP-ribose pyrophosphatase